jgi:hypothetical protein
VIEVLGDHAHCATDHCHPHADHLE